MRNWLFRPGTHVAGWLARLVGDARVDGLEHVPRTGSFILVSNHLSLADPPLLGWAVGYRAGRVVHFMAKIEMRAWPLVGWLATQSGVFFVRRGEGDRGAQREALALLAAGEGIGIFAEGTRSRNATLGEGRPGAAYLAIRSGAAVLPVAISGTERLFPGHSRLPHRTRIRVRIGPPFQLERPPGGRLDRATLLRASDGIMAAIAELLPERQRGRHRPGR